MQATTWMIFAVITASSCKGVMETTLNKVTLTTESWVVNTNGESTVKPATDDGVVIIDGHGAEPTTIDNYSRKPRSDEDGTDTTNGDDITRPTTGGWGVITKKDDTTKSTTDIRRVTKIDDCTERPTTWGPGATSNGEFSNKGRSEISTAAAQLVSDQTRPTSRSVVTKESSEDTVSENVTESASFSTNPKAGEEGVVSEYIQRLRKAEDVLWLYVGPTLIWTGTVANVLCIIVLQSPHFRRAPSSLTLTLLAFTDIANLWAGLLRRWVLHMTDFDLDIRESGQASCKLIVFAGYLFAFMSSWTLVLVNAERTISVWTPLRAREICSRKRIAMAWTILLAAMVGLNAHIFWTVLILEEYGFCYIKSDMAFDYIYWSDLMLSSVIPSIIIFAGNGFIAYRLTVAQARRKKMNAAEGKSPVNSTTIMLFVVCTVFILTTLPLAIFLLGTEDHFFPGVWDEEDTAEYSCIVAAMNMIYFLNNTSNFFLYLLSGKKFRAAFLAVICCRKGKKRNQRGPMSTLQTTTSNQLRSATSTSEGRV